MAHSTVARSSLAARGGIFEKTGFVEPASPAQTKAQPKRGILRRVLDSMSASRQRQADRLIANYLRSRGGRLTDEAEREIERRFLRQPGASWLD